MMRVDIVTLFVDTCRRMMEESILGRARREGHFQLFCHNIRDYTLSKQKRVDDAPYGGGHGMILQAEPIARCLDAILAQHRQAGRERPRICFMSPAGPRYTQQRANALAAEAGLVLVCGHYEGIDRRVIEEYADEEISIGDFVLSGGELAALSVADSVLRLQPGVLASAEGFTQESFNTGLLEHPHYTRPEEWRGRSVPGVLLSGHDGMIELWRYNQSVELTRQKRPDLLEGYARALQAKKTGEGEDGGENGAHGGENC